MGCASSREFHPSAGEGPEAAARPRLQPPATAASRTSSVSAHNDAGRLNQPLRAPSTVKHSPPQLALQPWTPSELARQRGDFFETRVSGRPEIWGALKRVCELMRTGDLKGAQTVFDASGATCPSGRLTVERRRGGQKKGGVYDEKGLLYEIPGWVVSDPLDLVQEVEGKGIDEETEDEDEGGVCEEKMKEMVPVRARLSDRGTDVVVEVGLNQKVAVLARKVQEKAGTEQKIKFAYMGKILDEHKTLTASGWKEGHILNALVFG